MDDITPEALDSLVAGLKNAGVNTPLNGSVPSGIRPLGFRNASASFRKPHIGSGELASVNATTGNKSRLIDSMAAKGVARPLDAIMAWDGSAGSWLRWNT